jgi:uncharacterized protein YndB with AHSA1/START domain
MSDDANDTTASGTAAKGPAGDTTGLTQDAGWEVGVRQTVPVPLSAVWEYLLGDGLPLWLGETTLPREKGGAYATNDGVVGEVRSYDPSGKVRLTWHPDDWPHDSTLQLSVREAATGTTIAIHHERLADRDERRMMLGHWKNVMEQLVTGVARA